MNQQMRNERKKRNIIWFKCSFNLEMKSNIGKLFLSCFISTSLQVLLGTRMKSEKVKNMHTEKYGG